MGISNIKIRKKKSKMLKPIIITENLEETNPLAIKLRETFDIWGEKIYRENSAALGGDINGILITNENQKIDDLVPTISSLVAIAITTGQDAAALKSAHPKVRVFKVGNVEEATTALVNAIDGVATITGEL